MFSVVGCVTSYTPYDSAIARDGDVAYNIGMIRLIVCDWNGTLFRDPLEERFFAGLCWRAVKRAIASRSLRALSSLAKAGLGCFGEYLSARGRSDKTLVYIARLVETLNPHVFTGISRTELNDYAARYAHQIQPRLDMRLIEPLRAFHNETNTPIAIISSGCREGIVPALAIDGLAVERVVANTFLFDGERTTGFRFDIHNNKADLLKTLLDEMQIDPAEVMYLGDSQADETCFAAVGYPVVSFFATPAAQERFARLHHAFVPLSEAHFKTHLRESYEL